MTKTAPARRALRAPVREVLDQQLVAAGLRRTPARADVLALLHALGQPLTRAELSERLPPGFDGITLYRTLECFVEAGLCQRTMAADRVSRYSLAAGAGNHGSHGHFQCTDCGHLFCVPAKVPLRAAMPPGFEVETASLSYTGHCAACTAVARPG